MKDLGGVIIPLSMLLLDWTLGLGVIMYISRIGVVFRLLILYMVCLGWQ
jgi:hypothetical protein